MSASFQFVEPESKGSTKVDTLPPSLQEMDIWVVESGKRPVYPSAKWQGDDGPITTTFEDAKAHLHRGDGLGVIIQPSHDLVCIDGDSVVSQSGEIRDGFAPILEASDSYAEYSQSGEGIHILVRGVDGLQSDRAMTHDFDDGGHIDLFGSQEARNIRLTGDVVGDNRTIRESSQFVQELHTQFLTVETTTSSTQIQHSIDGDVLDFEESEDYTPADVRATIETYAEYGTGGAQSRAERMLALWDSYPSPNPRDSQTRRERVSGQTYNSPSEADYDFLTGLAYYCRGDKSLMLRCWQASNRWTRPTKEKSSTYYHRTIENAAKASTTRISRTNIVEVDE